MVAKLKRTNVRIIRIINAFQQLMESSAHSMLLVKKELVTIKMENLLTTLLVKTT